MEESVVISILVVNNGKTAERYINHPKVEKVLDIISFLDMTDVSCLDLSQIEKFKHTQLKVENALTRYTNDYQLRKNIYYSGLSFWLGFFDSNQIDAVVIYGLSHGYTFDILPAEIAVNRGIPAYNVENCGPLHKGLYNSLTNLYTPLAHAPSAQSCTMESMFFWLKKSHPVSPFEGRLKQIEKLPLVKRFIWRILLALFGNNILIFHSCIKARSFTITPALGKNFEYNFFEYLWFYYRIKKMNGYLKKIEVSPRKDEKFVFYALHLEPEANIWTVSL